MKANELRINNLVYCKGIIDIIGGVDDISLQLGKNV